MSKEHKLTEVYLAKNDKSSNHRGQIKKETIKSDNSTRTLIYNQLLTQIEKDEEGIIRKDIIVYKLQIPYLTQAISILLMISLMIHAFIYLFLLKGDYTVVINKLSLIMFLWSGVMMLFSGFTIIQRSRILTRRKYKPTNYYRDNAKFAYVHSLTWFISAICMAIFSILIYYSKYY